jgi:hypothetical protein
MTVTDPDVPDPLNDPRTMQADPGAYGQGADLASAEDDPAAAGEDELAEIVARARGLHGRAREKGEHDREHDERHPNDDDDRRGSCSVRPWEPSVHARRSNS